MIRTRIYLYLTLTLVLLVLIPQTGRPNLPISSKSTGFQPETAKSQATGAEKQKYNFYQSNWFVGVVYPGLTCGYRNKYFSLEIRGFSGKDVKLLGPRLTTPLARYRKMKFYWGIDAFKVKEFEGELTEGEGHMVGTVIGFEKYFDQHFSFTLDSGPYFIKLEDDLSGQEVDGLEFVVNTGINFYF